MDNKEYRRQYIQRRRDAAPRILCACGCGTEIPSLSAALMPQRYALGHTEKKRGHKKERVNIWWSRARAREIKGPGACELEHIGGCLGRKEVHHLDTDVHNNDLSNLMRLCMAHHRLVERGVVDLANPAMPRFHVSGGKRRYEHTYAYVHRKFSSCGGRLEEKEGAP